MELGGLASSAGRRPRMPEQVDLDAFGLSDEVYYFELEQLFETGLYCCRIRGRHILGPYFGPCLFPYHGPLFVARQQPGEQAGPLGRWGRPEQQQLRLQRAGRRRSLRWLTRVRQRVETWRRKSL